MTLPVGLTATAVDALRDKIRGLLPPVTAPDGVEVFDGPAPEKAYQPRWVSVAAAFEDEQGGIQEAVSVERIESGARPSVTERLTVACSAYAGGGDTVLEANREAAGRLLTAVDDGLRADRTLGGAVSLARLASAQWLQGRDTKGTGVAIGYTVELVSLS